MCPKLKLAGIFSPSELQIINAGLRRLDEKEMILAAIARVDGFDEQKAAIIKKLREAK